MELGCGVLLHWFFGWAVFPTLLWLGVPESLWWGDESCVQIKGSLLEGDWSLDGLTVLADLLFLRVWDEPLRFPWEVAVSLGGAFPEVLVPTDMDISGEAVGAGSEARALGFREMW